MSIEADVLRALLKLARRRSNPSLDTLVRAVTLSSTSGHQPSVDEAIIRRALFSLAQSGLIQRTSGGLALTLPGLAIAAAAGKIAQEKRARAGNVKKTTATTTLRRRRAA